MSTKKKTSSVPSPVVPKGEFTDKGSESLAAQGRFLFGKVPEEFSPRRLMAAQALGFRFFKLNKTEREQLKDDNFVYDGMFWDATLCAYLCLCKVSDLFRAVRTPDAVGAEVMSWADSKEISAGTAVFAEVMAHYTAVMEAIIRSSAEQVKGTNSGNVVARGEELPGD